MVNKLPAPTIEPELFGGFKVHYTVSTKEGTALQSEFFPNHEKADNFYQHRLSVWALEPLLSWCKQQEHLANVQQLTYAARKESINKLAKLTRAFLALPNLTAVQTAEFISNKAVPGLQRAYPGHSSIYYNHTVELERYLDEMDRKLVTIYLSPIIAHQKATAQQAAPTQPAPFFSY